MTCEKKLTIAEQLKNQLNTPKTETKIVLEQNELYPDLAVKKSKLSPAARSKVVNKNQPYQSQNQEGFGPCSYSGCPHSTTFDLDIGIEGCKWWARNPHYGTSLPGYWKPSPTVTYYSRENLWLNHIGHAYDADSLIGQNNLYTVNTVGLYAAEDYEFCLGTQNLIRECTRLHEQGYPINETKTLPSETTRATKWTIKVGVVAGSALIPGATPLAVAAVGGASWAGSEAVKSLCNSDKAKHAWSIVSDAGSDAVRGAVVGKYVETAGWLAGAGMTGNSLVGDMVGKFAGNVETVKGGIELSGNAFYHASHLKEGSSYDYNCPICNNS